MYRRAICLAGYCPRCIFDRGSNGPVAFCPVIFCLGLLNCVEPLGASPPLMRGGGSVLVISTTIVRDQARF